MNPSRKALECQRSGKNWRLHLLEAKEQGCRVSESSGVLVPECALRYLTLINWPTAAELAFRYIVLCAASSESKTCASVRGSSVPGK